MTYNCKIIDDEGTLGVFDPSNNLIFSWKSGHPHPNVFTPFKQNGKQLALYMRHYTSLRVMELPSCKDIGGFEEDSFGFCVTDTYIPKYFTYRYKDKDYIISEPFTEKQLENYKNPEILDHDFALVSGCIWSAPWEVRIVDLSQASEGILTYLDHDYIPDKSRIELKDLINLDNYDKDTKAISILSPTYFSLTELRKPKE